MIRPIIQLGNPILRQISSEVSPIKIASSQIASLIEDLRDTLRDFQHKHHTGRGIAAPQVGVNERIIYIETTDFCYTLINPQYLYKSAELFSVWDSCFSYWGICFKVMRHKHVKISYLSETGAPTILEVDGALAELIQHEMEHLDGRVAIDQLIPVGNVCVQL